jgi:ABC-type antimicrobial peptide transport system permease subunit
VSVQARGVADVDAAMTVLRYKSAKYSVERPLHIGATLAAGSDRQLAELGAFGLPLGEAFQLRDDLLGVFGDPSVTGKPAGGDLIEGKRTVLVALALDAALSEPAAQLDAALGGPLDAEQVEALRLIIDESGAHAQVEEVIGGKSYDGVDWMELNHGLFTALRIQQILMSLVLALIILVAAFTVIATLIMVVLDKKREIATIKAMGARDMQLLRAFLYQGLIIGLTGAVSGLGFGFVVCRWILAYGFPLDPKVYFIDHLPVMIRPSEFLLTGAFAILACLFATVWPALHAARLRPAEAFRESA